MLNYQSVIFKLGISGVIFLLLKLTFHTNYAEDLALRWAGPTSHGPVLQHDIDGAVLYVNTISLKMSSLKAASELPL